MDEPAHVPVHPMVKEVNRLGDGDQVFQYDVVCS